MALRTAVAALAIACSGCAGSTPKPEAAPRHIVPPELAQVAIADFELVSYLDVDLHTAVQTREAVESEFGKAYGQAGHPRWFFHAFDRENLDFIVARYEPQRGEHGTPARYVAQRRLRVKRTRSAERALGVTDVVRDYELRTLSVRSGVTRHQIRK